MHRLRFQVTLELTQYTQDINYTAFYFKYPELTSGYFFMPKQKVPKVIKGRRIPQHATKVIDNKKKKQEEKNKRVDISQHKNY